jgi:hypothetical protein
MMMMMISGRYKVYVLEANMNCV